MTAKRGSTGSVLDHMCVSKDLVATINVLTNYTTDHFPLLRVD
jgi:hypothetical protein